MDTAKQRKSVNFFVYQSIPQLHSTSFGGILGLKVEFLYYMIKQQKYIRHRIIPGTISVQMAVILKADIEEFVFKAHQPEGLPLLWEN